MKSSVYDTILVAKANGSIAGRHRGNLLDRRLCLLENAIERMTNTLVNSKLLHEYRIKIMDVAIRNDTIHAFLQFVFDHGIDSHRSTLSSSDYDRARNARWPIHDQHLIAAAIGGANASIYVTEKRHVACSNSIRKSFKITIVQC